MGARDVLLESSARPRGQIELRNLGGRQAQHIRRCEGGTPQTAVRCTAHRVAKACACASALAQRRGVHAHLGVHGVRRPPAATRGRARAAARTARRARPLRASSPNRPQQPHPPCRSTCPNSGRFQLPPRQLQLRPSWARAQAARQCTQALRMSRGRRRALARCACVGCRAARRGRGARRRARPVAAGARAARHARRLVAARGCGPSMRPPAHRPRVCRLARGATRGRGTLRAPRPFQSIGQS
eukprot:5145317-Prymnesium_polylepis.2